MAEVEIPMTPDVLKQELRNLRALLYQHVRILTYQISDLALDYEIEDEHLEEIMAQLTWLSGHARDEAAFPTERYMQ